MNVMPSSLDWMSAVVLLRLSPVFLAVTVVLRSPPVRCTDAGPSTVDTFATSSSRTTPAGPGIGRPLTWSTDTGAV